MAALPELLLQTAGEMGCRSVALLYIGEPDAADVDQSASRSGYASTLLGAEGVLELTDTSWEGYLAGLSKHHRYQTRKEPPIYGAAGFRTVVRTGPVHSAKTWLPAGHPAGEVRPARAGGPRTPRPPRRTRRNGRQLRRFHRGARRPDRQLHPLPTQRRRAVRPHGRHRAGGEGLLLRARLSRDCSMRARKRNTANPLRHGGVRSQSHPRLRIAAPLGLVRVRWFAGRHVSRGARTPVAKQRAPARPRGIPRSVSSFPICAHLNSGAPQQNRLHDSRGSI